MSLYLTLPTFPIMPDLEFAVQLTYGEQAARVLVSWRVSLDRAGRSEFKARAG